jgi:hypothetical protein
MANVPSAEPYIPKLDATARPASEVPALLAEAASPDPAFVSALALARHAASQPFDTKADDVQVLVEAHDRLRAPGQGST